MASQWEVINTFTKRIRQKKRTIPAMTSTTMQIFKPNRRHVNQNSKHQKGSQEANL